MQADWEAEVGGGAAVLDGMWPGWVDLHANPERVGELAEVAQLPSLGAALIALNGAESAIWTAKCDVWTVEELVGLDADELEAGPENLAAAVACYVDCLPRAGRVFAGLADAEVWAREVVGRLGEAVAGCCRADLVVREAVAGAAEGMGVTVYLTACGATLDAAREHLGDALDVFAEAVRDAGMDAAGQSATGYNENAGE